MALPTTLQDREVQKFVEDDEGNVAVRVQLTGDFTTTSNFKIKISANDLNDDFVENKFVAGSSKVVLAVVNDGGDEDFSIDIAPANIPHQDLSGAGSNDHAAIDTHIANLANPHGVTKTQVGLGSVTNDAQLKIASNLADLADAPTARTNLGLGSAAVENTSAFEAAGSIATHAALTDSVHGISTFGASLVDDADAATARSTLGLGTISTEAETAYFLLAGRSGGQTAIGGTGASDNLTLQSSSNPTKGKLLFGTSAYDEVNERLGVGIDTPTSKIHIVSSSAGTVASIIKGASAQTADLTEWQNSASTVLASVSAAGLGQFSGLGIGVAGVSGKLYVGAAPTTPSHIASVNSAANPTSGAYGINSDFTVTTSSNNTGFAAAVAGGVTYASATAMTRSVGAAGQTALCGLNGFVGNNVITAAPVTSVTGVAFQNLIRSGSVVTDAIGACVNPARGDVGSSAVTTVTGLWVKSAGGTLSVTDERGIYIEASTRATNKWAIYAEGGNTYHNGSVGIGSSTIGAKLHVTNTAAATIASIVKGASGQTANLTEWQDSSANILSFINSTGRATFVGFGIPSSNLTIASGAITRTRSYHVVDGEGSAADDLATINGGSEGDILIIRSNNDSRNITVKHGTGNIQLTGSVDCVLENNEDTLTLIFAGSNWLEVARSLK